VRHLRRCRKLLIVLLARRAVQDPNMDDFMNMFFGGNPRQRQRQGQQQQQQQQGSLVYFPGRRFSGESRRGVSTVIA